ncbi:hypothetical protein EDB81DRAFT_672272, partial [Dactylonectria macrodidyma]
FITNLDRWGVMALIATASYHQAKALRDSFYRYLAFEGYIGVTIPASPSYFHLSFDLPFYAWRKARPHRPPCDFRTKSDNGPLRHVTDLSFLQRTTTSPLQTETDYLCEAQVSVSIVGCDNWRWIAYCFTYHDEMEDEDGLSGGLQCDPLTAGEHDANQPLLTPREYFLRVLEVRLRQVRDEWLEVVRNMRHRVHEYVRCS